MLYDVMHSHVQALLDAAEDVAARAVPPAAKLRDLTAAFLRLYAGAAARHRVLLNELQRLPEKQRATIIAIQRRLIEIVEGALEELRPDLKAPLKRPAAMLYFGMINWTHTWLDPAGPRRSTADRRAGGGDLSGRYRAGGDFGVTGCGLPATRLHSPIVVNCSGTCTGFAHRKSAIKSGA